MEMNLQKYGKKIDDGFEKVKKKMEYDRAMRTIGLGKFTMILRGALILVDLEFESDPKVRAAKKKELNFILFGLDVANTLNPEK